MNIIPTNKRFLVYLASNHQGLDVERHEIVQLMASYGMVNVGLDCRDDLGPYNWDLVRELIETCDLFVLLLGDSYGPRLPTGISFLHREFVHANSTNKPTLAFIKNSVPNQQLNEEQSRLAGLHKVVAQKSPYKLWHLRDELVSQVRTALSSSLLTIGGGWVPANKANLNLESDVKKQEPVPLTARQRLTKSQQMLNLQVTANVYQDGNLSVEDIFLPTRLDKLFKVLLHRMKEGCSEDSLRRSLAVAVTKTTKEQLLAKKPKAHAVDDVRINREQFKLMLKIWQELGTISCKKDENRSLCYFLSEDI